jgi:hypothetical protein
MAQVRIHDHKDGAPGSSHALHGGRSEAPLMLSDDHLKFIALFEPFCFLEKTIARIIVDEDDLIANAFGVHDFIDLPDKEPDVARLLVGGHNDGHNTVGHERSAPGE